MRTHRVKYRAAPQGTAGICRTLVVAKKNKKKSCFGRSDRPTYSRPRYGRDPHLREEISTFDCSLRKKEKISDFSSTYLISAT